MAFGTLPRYQAEAPTFETHRGVWLTRKKITPFWSRVQLDSSDFISAESYWRRETRSSVWIT